MANALIPIPTSYEPKRKNRWLVKFPDEIGLTEWVLDTTHRPSVTVKNGKVNFDPITIKFRDPIGPSTTQRLMMLFDAQTFKKQTLFEKIKRFFNKKIKIRTDTSKHSGYEIFKNGFDYKLSMLDPTSVEIERWEIIGCKIISIDFGELSYSNDGLADVTIIIQPKYFQFHF